MSEKVCYIINFYLGDRRKTIDEFKGDRLFFLRKQIEYLYKVKNSLSKVIFNFNIRNEDLSYVSEIFKITPKYIQGTEIEINFRENFGMSYAAWAEMFEKHKDSYEYFIFNEDDYFFVEDNWDSYLKNKFKSLENCGYFCMVVREPNEWCDFKKHGGHPAGISSSKVLNEVYNKLGSLPHSNKNNYSDVEKIQISFTNEIVNLGYEIYDVRNEFRIEFALTESPYDIWRLFWWNEKYILKPAIILDNKPHSYWESYDDEFKTFNEKNSIN